MPACGEADAAHVFSHEETRSEEHQARLAADDPAVLSRGLIQWHCVYTKPSKKAIQSVKDKVKAKTYRSTRGRGTRGEASP
jgi:hypothetical protein